MGGISDSRELAKSHGAEFKTCPIATLFITKLGSQKDLFGLK
jgi:hypothetical protein